jgi:sigma-B regulation protein RsbU (phosphoserine phosphatase)
MDFLEIIDAQGRRKRVRLDRPRLLIGREPTCDINLPSPSVSRRHAQLQRTDDGLWVLQDLNSRNHIYVDGVAVQQIVLNLGKQVRIADYRLVLHEMSKVLSQETDPFLWNDRDDSSWLESEPGWLEMLQTFQRSLLRLEDPRKVLEEVAAEVRRVTRPELVAIGLSGPERYSWELIQDSDGNPMTDLRLLEEARARAAGEESGVQSWAPSTTTEEPPSAVPPLCLLFPMKGRTGIIGHVFIRRPRFFPVPASVERYLSLLAMHAGLVWDNLQIGILRLALQTLERELHLARQIQIELFPPTFELDDRLEVFGVNLPSVKVSGDYYDVFRTGPDTMAFVIADAMGHGVPAALLMAAVRASLRMGLLLGLPWDAVFQGLDVIISQARGDALVVGVVGQIDLARQELHLVSAGHPLPSILVDGRPVLVPAQCQTRPWGISFESPWEVGRLSLAGQDWSIVCFTDGITEAAARGQRQFGTRRVVAYHHEHRAASAEDLCQGLLGQVAAEQETDPLPDDQTVLVLRSARTV